MSNKTYRVFLEKLGGTTADDFVGTQGDLFFDPENPVLRVANGAPGGATVSGGGGGVSGNIVISSTNSAINFVANSSGDGYGYSTIELRPDQGTYSDQYLIIDPTAPSHIHIRAGGTQDQSQAELYLGGEQDYVRVKDNTGVRIQSVYSEPTLNYYTTEFTSASWFTEDGSNYVQYTTSNTGLVNDTYSFQSNPANRLEAYYDGGMSSYNLKHTGFTYDLGGGTYKVSVDAAPPASPTTLSAMQYQLYNDFYNSLQLDTTLDIDVKDNVYITGGGIMAIRNYNASEPISIITDYDNTEKRFDFNANGTVTFADGSVQTGASISIAELKALVANSATYADFQNAIAAL